MQEIYMSIFREEITTHMEMRVEELRSEAFRHYKRMIKLFDEYLYQIGHNKKEIPKVIIDKWIKKTSKGISVNTTSQHIRQLLIYFTNCGYPCFIPKTVITKDTYVLHLYSDVEIKKIFILADSLKAPYAVKNVYIENELPMLLRLLFCCGFRVGETLNIKLGDIDFQRNLIVLRVTKKYKQRLVLYDENLADIIYRYCVTMGILTDSETYLFPTIDKNISLTSDAVRNYFKKFIKNLEIHDKKSLL